jgi:predicted SPOUT superfamily RNA methylase MTH1
VNKKLDPGTRVTIKLEPIKSEEKFRKGQIVSPLTPLETTGEYWGYQVRLADSLTTAMNQSPFKEGYDLIIGTSERGKDVDDVRFLDFKHALIVFGGVRGLEEAVENDDAITTSDPSDLFKFYINICPNQGSRTIRTEEAVFIALSVLRDKFFG